MAKKNAMTEEEMDRITRSTAEELADQPKRRIRLHQVPVAAGDPPMPDETVCINGYIYQIKRGEDVEVPESVYQVLVQAGRI